MHLRTMTVDERLAFLALARHAIAADGVIMPAEEERLEDCRRVAGLLRKELVEDLTWDQAADRISKPQSRRITFLALCELLYADNRLDPAEAMWIDEVRNRWELPSTFATACLDLMARQAALRQEADSLVMG